MAPRKKPRRRKPNTGTIRQKPGRDRPWEAAFPLGHGEYRYDSFATRPEAEAHLDRLTAERDRAVAPRNIPGGSQRVDVFLTTWLNVRQPHLKPNTLLSYTYFCNLAVAEIGAYRLDEVSRERADTLIAYFHRRGFKAVTQLRAVLRQAFEYALEEDYITRNPFQRVKAPPVEHRQAIALTEAQRTQLLATAAGTALEVLWHLYSRLGLRKGEGIGLRWCDVDFHTETIVIVQQYTSWKGKTILSTPKTKRSARRLPLPSDILELLRRLRTEQTRLAAQTRDWVMTGLVFTNDCGEHLTIGHVDWEWGKLRRRAGLPEQVTIHDLRHTALWHLENAGAPFSVVQAIAGHATATMTRHYTDHAGLEEMRKALGA